MSEDELQEFLKIVTPMLKELPEEEIQAQLAQIDMSDDERENFYKILMMLKEEEA